MILNSLAMHLEYVRCFRKKHMAWFSNWFSKKISTADGFPSDSELLDQGQTAKSAATGSHNAAKRKTMRMEQRELLYGVVRETMTRLGLITTSYKYKVLSLDPQGRQYLIMMDIKQDKQNHVPFMSKIEHLLTQESLSRHGIQIAGVYWRFSENKALAENALLKPDISVKPAPTPIPEKPPAGDSIEAKKALEKVLHKSREHREAAQSAFPDTLVFDPEERAVPLSNTQHGTLK